MPIQGLRDTSNFVANQRPENWRQGLMLLYPNSAEAAKAPLTALTSLMKSESSNDPVYHWWEKSMQTRRVALGASLTAPAAGTVQSVTVVSGALGFKTGDVFLVEHTEEVVQVTADPSSDTSLTLQRGAAGSTVTAVTYNGAGVNPNLVCIGSAFEEGSLAPTGVAFDPTDAYNYMQIFRSTLEMTRTAMKTRLRTPDQHKEAKRECLELIGVDMERAFFFGRRSTGVKDGKPIRFTGGLMSTIPAGNKLSVTGNSLTMLELESFMLQIFRTGSSEKMAFAGLQALNTIQQTVRKNAQWNIQNGLKEFGMAVTRITTPFGELVLKAHPLFSQMAGGITGGSAYYGMDTSMFVLDMGKIKYRYLEDSDLTFEDELEVPGMDGVKEGYIAECGLEVNHASTHFLIKGMVVGAKDA